MIQRTHGTKWFNSLTCPTSEGFRLFVFPYAGGGTAAFRGWRDRLPSWISLQVVQLPGRESRFSEPPVSRGAEIVEPVAEAIARMDNVPFALFGHSMGAILAFEVAREMRRRKYRVAPSALIISARSAPQLRNRTPSLAHLNGVNLIRQVMELYGGIPPQVLADPELIELMVRVIKADLQIVENYQYSPESPIECPIIAFGGSDDPWVPEHDLNAWHQQTTGSFALHTYPGGHFYFRPAESEHRLLTQLDVICGAAIGTIPNYFSSRE
jgi:medium-chain acyl-[acyl-carrier-protein] hydrolase